MFSEKLIGKNIQKNIKYKNNIKRVKSRQPKYLFNKLSYLTILQNLQNKFYYNLYGYILKKYLFKKYNKIVNICLLTGKFKHIFKKINLNRKILKNEIINNNVPNLTKLC